MAASEVVGELVSKPHKGNYEPITNNYLDVPGS